MRLFKKRDKNRQVVSQLFGRLNQAMERGQRKAAAYLGRKTQYWNRSSKLIALVLFCLLFGGCCLLLLLKAIIHF